MRLMDGEIWRGKKRDRKEKDRVRREIGRKGRKAQTALETMTAIDKAGGCGNCFHKIMNELRAV